MRHPIRNGLTLIELLIVIAIIGLLLQFTLPAIEMSREAARQAQCKSNLRQVALAFQNHHDTHGHYPSSGWGWQWVGHPDRGYGKDQPGGWAYNVLPFIEEQAIRDIGSGLEDGSSEQQMALFTANSTPIALLYCPSRRLPRAYPVTRKAVGRTTVGFSPLLPEPCRMGEGEKCKLARADYAANAGSFSTGADAGPNSVAEADDWPWKSEADDDKRQDGISFQRSLVKVAEVTDGLSHTYCVGEKYVPVACYKNGASSLDATSLFSGYDADMNRCTGRPDGLPRRITRDTEPPRDQHFGSAHPQIFHMSFCDGSVRLVSYDVDGEVHRLLGSRNDGSSVSSEQLSK